MQKRPDYSGPYSDALGGFPLTIAEVRGQAPAGQVGVPQWVRGRRRASASKPRFSGIANL